MNRFGLTFFSLCLIVHTGHAWAQTRGIERNKDALVSTEISSAGSFRALIIGNNDYQDSSGLWPNLSTALQDARSLAHVLENSYGFDDVRLLSNATRRDIILELNHLARRVGPQDSILIYYAGHGFLDRQTDRGYWIPVDAQGDDITTFIRNSAVRDEVALIAKNSRHTLLISDSCFSGSLLRGGTRAMGRNLADDFYYQKVASKKSVQIFSAGGVEFVDDNFQQSGHSPFTYFLLNELNANRQPQLSLSELSTNVAKAVANNVLQTPEVGVLYGAGDELGEFIFTRADEHVLPALPQKSALVQDIIQQGKAAAEDAGDEYHFIPRF